MRHTEIVRLLAIDLTGHDPEIVADRCWQSGATGIWEIGFSEGGATALRAGVDDRDLPTFLADLADLAPRDVTDVEAVELAGQAATFEFAGHRVDLWVPATVFGDASHPTTVSCLEFLDDLARTGDDVLDVGCGSGALSVAAALRGARVTAIDVDPEAVSTTADNAARNGLSVSASLTPLAEVDRTFDLVVANMTVGALAPLLADLRRCTAAGGTIVVSGMLVDQWDDVHAGLGGDVIDVRSVDGWVSAAVAAQ